MPGENTRRWASYTRTIFCSTFALEANCMKRFVCKVIFAATLVLANIGCATTPQITKGSSDYLQKGMVSAKFRANEFYMVIGEVDLYHYEFGAI